MRTNLRLLLVVCFIWLSGSQLLFSQSADFFDGKVINSTSSKPVPFANIKLKNNRIGVYANAAGDFKISRNPEFQDDSILISCIGYKQSSLAYKNLSDTTINKVSLNPIVYGLGEVKIVASKTRLNSIAIIRRALVKIKNNYPDKPFSYISYYRDYQKKDGNYINLNEAIIQTLDRGFSAESISNQYRMLDFRKNTEFPRMNISPDYNAFESAEYDNPNKTIPKAIPGDQYGNELFILMVHDAIRNFNRRSFSFIEIFSENFISNHNFSDPSPVYNNNLLLQKISFNGRSRIVGDSLTVSGTIYIQPKDYSIHKLEYTCYYNIKGKGLKEMFHIDTEYGYNNPIDSGMYLKYISFNNLFRVMDNDDSSYFKITDSHLDTERNIMATVIISFNNKIDPVTASKRDNYEIIIGKNPLKFKSVQVIGKNLYLRFKDEDLKDKRDSIFISVRNVKDIYGNYLDKRKSMELYQYRELFVQDYNKSLPFKDSCYMQYLPLEQNCISRYSGNFNYWMNTPENIKINK